MKRISVGTLILTLFLPLLIGGLSAGLSSKGMALYTTMNKPPLSPPAVVFPVVWLILYLMMGLASHFVLISEAEAGDRMTALILYAVQLAMNFMWSIIFFGWGLYMAAFVWLIVMWCLVIICTIRFFGISKIAAYLLIPYIIWLTFAAYLNLGVSILNKGN